MRMHSAGSMVIATMMLTACAGETLPTEPLTLENIEGSYTLERVGGKPLPVKFGVCTIAGCAVISTVTGGTLEIGSHIEGTWQATIVELDGLGGTQTTRYVGRDATLEGGNTFWLWLKDPVGLSTGPLRATADQEILTVIIESLAYEFRKSA